MTQYNCCLSWNNYELNLGDFCSRLYRKESMTDVTLVSEEGILTKAHKFVLSASSSYFEKIFANSAPAAYHVHPIVVLKDIHSTDLLDLLSFMYTGSVTVAHDRMNDFLSAAESLQVKDLSAAMFDLHPGPQTSNNGSGSDPLEQEPFESPEAFNSTSNTTASLAPKIPILSPPADSFNTTSTLLDLPVPEVGQSKPGAVEGMTDPPEDQVHGGATENVAESISIETGQNNAENEANAGPPDGDRLVLEDTDLAADELPTFGLVQVELATSDSSPNVGVHDGLIRTDSEASGDMMETDFQDPISPSTLQEPMTTNGKTGSGMELRSNSRLIANHRVTTGRETSASAIPRSKGKINGRYWCGQCGHRFKASIQFKAHVSAVHSKEYVCDRCNRRFSRSGNLKRHNVTMHKTSLDDL